MDLETEALPDYYAHFNNDNNRNRYTYLKTYTRVKRRGSYSDVKVGRKNRVFLFSPVSEHCWKGMRTRMMKELTENSDVSESLIRDFFESNKDYITLNSLARKYLYDDYRISPRTARLILYDALEKLVDSEELKRIEPDPLEFVSLEPRKNKRKTKKQRKITTKTKKPAFAVPAAYPVSVACGFSEGVLAES